MGLWVLRPRMSLSVRWKRSLSANRDLASRNRTLQHVPGKLSLLSSYEEEDSDGEEAVKGDDDLEGRKS